MQSFKWYFATTTSTIINVYLEERAPYILVSYAYFKNGLPDNLVKAVRAGRCSLMLDSGGFTNLRQPGRVTVEGYIDYLKTHKGLLSDYVVLDHLEKRRITLSNIGKMRNAGLSPMLVDHMWFRWIPELHTYYKTGEKMCWGGMVKPNQEQTQGALLRRGEWLKKRLTERREHAVTGSRSKVHLLGVGHGIRKFAPWLDVVDSFDSASIVHGATYGNVTWLEVNKEGWPVLKHAHYKNKPEVISRAAKSSGLDMSRYVDRVHLGVRAAKRFFAMFEKRLDRARKDGDDIVKISKAEQLATFDYPVFGVAENDDGVIVLDKPADQWDVRNVWAMGFESTSYPAADSEVVEKQVVWPQAKTVRTLKVPDPEHLIDRLADDKKAGLLSRNTRQALVGEEMLLINERLKEGEPTRAWGKVTLEKGVPMKSGADAIESLGAKIDNLTAREFTGEKSQVWYHPLRLIEKYDKPRVIGDVPGRRYSGSVEDEPKKAEPSVAAGVLPKALGSMKDDDLMRMMNVLSQEYERRGRDASKPEDLINAARFVLDEMKRREMKLPDCALAQEATGMLKSEERKTAEIAPSGEEQGRVIELSEVLDTFGDAVIRRGAVTVVGGVVNQGQTKNDIDVLVRGPLDDATRKAIEFRVGRMIGAKDPDLADRIQFLDESMGGPFTDHVEAFDLVLVARKDQQKIEMRDVEKADDPLMDLVKDLGPQPAVLQAHHRGASVHLDLRLKMDGHLTGWTLTGQKAGAVPDVETVEQARRIANRYDVKGSPEFKPLLAPSKMLAVPKTRQPLPWLEVSDRVIKPGELGATERETGVLVAVDRPKWEQGVVKPYFKEVFLTGGKKLSGVLFFRKLVGRGEDDDSGRRTAEGETFWTAHLSKDALPSILSTRAVERGDMPPDGRSWIPRSLEAVTPKEFRYWEKKGVEARKVRDALVDSGYFTDKNVRVVDGQFRRVVTKQFLWLKPEIEECPPKGGEGYCKPVRKAADVRDFVLARQTFKGQQVTRTGPTRTSWFLMFPAERGLHVLRMDHDPTEGTDPIAGTHIHQRTDALMQRDDGPVKPGEKVGGFALNPTKDTSSDWRVVDRGKVSVLDEEPGRWRLSFQGKDLQGVYLAEAEEEGSAIWTLRRDSKAVGKAVPVKDGIQMWDPKKKVPGADRRLLKPPAIFAPQKPSREYYSNEEAADKFATGEALKSGVAVEPKLNGRVIVLERDADGRVVIYFEDTRRDRAKYFPSLSKAVKAIDAPVVLVGELVEYDGDTPLPRRELARYGQDKVHDDSKARVHVWDVLYWGGRNHLDQPWEKRKGTRDQFFRGRGLPFVNVPSKVVRSRDELMKALTWAAKADASEGAMLKTIGGTYSLGGQTSSDAKVKLTRAVRAIVLDKDLKTTPPGQRAPARTYVYTCGVGPISATEAERWKDTDVHDGKTYVMIGKTMASNVQAKIGDTLLVNATELLLDTGESRSLTWFTPMVEENVNAAPMSVDAVRALVREDEIKKLASLPWGRALPLMKADSLRFVLGVVLEPNDGKGDAPLDPDSQKDIYSEEEIREAAWQFLAEYRQIGEMHERTVGKDQIEVVESYVAPVDMAIDGERIRKGTWMLGARVKDGELWRKIKRGEYGAWSVDGTASRKPMKN
jgi:hypothetical protein